MGPSPGARRGWALMWTMAGRANEIVLPDPVSAMATTSRPERAIGQAWHWDGGGEGEAHGPDLGQDVFGKAGLFERRDGSRDIGALDL